MEVIEKEMEISMDEAKKRIISLINDFGEVTKTQLMSYIGDRDVCGQALGSLMKNKKISYDVSRDVYMLEGCTDHERLELWGARKALAVYIDYMSYDAGEYVLSPDSDIIMTFELNGILVDIIYVRFGKELSIGNILRMKERYLSPKDRETISRIVIVDKEKQIPEIDIVGTQAFVLIGDDNIPEYIKPTI